MATGFKSATVRAADVPATQTNFPAYVDLDRLGITTLAEAQSVRVYADSAKTTEWAREIVSVTEMHVKVPSLTSTVSMFVDWDGVRSDYAVGATYGRNAVWSDYTDVIHFSTDPSTGSVLNSTGGTNLTTASFESGDLVAGKVGDALNIDSTADGLPQNTTTSFTSTFVMSWWLKPDLVQNYNMIMGAANGWGSFYAHTSSDSGSGTMYAGTSLVNRFVPADTGAGVYVIGTWVKMDYRWVGGTGYLYKNGAQIASKAQSTPAAWGGLVISSTDPNNAFDGLLDELRTVGADRSANWITTEYNNQNAEATFWGTWANVSTATTVTNIISIGNIVELNNISSIIGA